MAFTALVTLLLLLQYAAFMAHVAWERYRGGVAAPACDGDERYQRALRVQLNTLEHLIVVLPLLWISAIWFPVPVVAPLCGLGFLAARLLYRRAYLRDPATRRPGMLLGLVCIAVLGLTAAWGVLPGL